MGNIENKDHNENKQKKIIWTAIVIVFLICIAGIGIYIFGLLNSQIWAQIVGMISNFISPTTLFGIVVKQFMNTKQKKDIQKIISPVEEVKIKKKEIVTPKTKKTDMLLDGQYFRVFKNENNLVFVEKLTFTNESEYRSCLIETINKIDNLIEKKDIEKKQTK